MHANNDRPGGLRSSLNIEIHSNYAIRLWEGRSSTKDKETGKTIIYAVASMPYTLWRAGIIYQDSMADNPWADEMMFNIEELLNKAGKYIQGQLETVEKILKSIPPGITFSDHKSSSPLNIGVYCSSPLGYRCVWVLVGYDQMALKAFQAYQYGLISRLQRDQLLRQCAHRIRKVYAAIRPYRTVKANRDDLVKQTPAAQEAIQKMGTPDSGILTGSKRSSFSPPLRRSHHPIVPDDEVS